MKLMQLTESEVEVRCQENPESVFFKYSTQEDAQDSYDRKFANPRFNNDELFVFEVVGRGWVVQTTGSLVKAGA